MIKRAVLVSLMLFFFTILSSLTLDLKIAASPLESVNQSRHNLIASISEESNSCTVCHTNGIPWRSENKEELKGDSKRGAGLPPLWNKNHSTISPYRAMQTLPLSEHPYNHPTGSSLVCLSCHDGALGTDMHGINVGDPRVGAAANVPFDGMAGQRGAPPLSRVDHPISITYPRKPDGHFIPIDPTVTQARYFALPDRSASGLTLPTNGISSYLDLPKGNLSSAEQLSTLVRTTGGMMECDSCHDPHNQAVRPFLRVPSATLCLVCHDR